MYRSRRAVLAALGSGLLAGCGSSKSESTRTNPDRSEATATATGTQESTGTSSGEKRTSTSDAGSPPNVPGDRFYPAGAMRKDNLAARLVERDTIPRIRYWDDYQHRHEHVEPKRDRFLKLSVLFVNQGGEKKSLHIPENDNEEMRAWAGGEAVKRLTALYGDVKKQDVRIPIDADFSIEDVTLGYSTKAIPAGKGTVLSFLFDVPASDTYLMQWDSKRPVEGHEKPVFLGLKPRD